MQKIKQNRLTVESTPQKPSNITDVAMVKYLPLLPLQIQWSKTENDLDCGKFKSLSGLQNFAELLQIIKNPEGRSIYFNNNVTSSAILPSRKKFMF